MTTNNWRAPEKVGEDIGLTSRDLSQFLSTVREIHKEKVERNSENYDFSKDYFDFLNQEVFSDSRIINKLRELGVDDETISQFRAGGVDIEGAFEEHRRFKFRLDEIVDLIMLIKLVQDYLEITDHSWVEPRDRLHYLLYLVNSELRDSSVQSVRNQRTDLGMLEFTGYGYTFRKGERGPYSSRLERDKDRLFAWDIVYQEVCRDYDPNEFEPFRVQLGRSGEILTMRYNSSFDSFRQAESELLREWAFQQRRVLERFAGLPIEELREHVLSINEYGDTREGRVILTGRPRFFDPKQEDSISTISGGMQFA